MRRMAAMDQFPRANSAGVALLPSNSMPQLQTLMQHYQNAQQQSEKAIHPTGTLGECRVHFVQGFRPAVAPSSSHLRTVDSRGDLVPLVKPKALEAAPLRSQFHTAPETGLDDLNQALGDLQEVQQRLSTIVAQKQLHLKGSSVSPEEALSAVLGQKELTLRTSPVQLSVQPAAGKSLSPPSSFPPLPRVESSSSAVHKASVGHSRIRKTPSPPRSPKVIPHKAGCAKINAKFSCTANPSQTQKVLCEGGDPHKLLLDMLRQRNYSTTSITSFEAGYLRDPTPLQLASFGNRVVQAVHGGKTDELQELLSLGLSGNPCNAFGDSILNLVCKRGDVDTFQCLMDNGSSLNVCDSWGRTPLHHIACAKGFCEPIVRMILDTDVNQLLLQDKQGRCPLQYVRKEQCGEWCAFLSKTLRRYWPLPSKRPPLIPSVISPGGKGTQLLDPDNTLSVDLARAIASGKVTPQQVSTMDAESRRSYCSS